jgi:hypothetical protein
MKKNNEQILDRISMLGKMVARRSIMTLAVDNDNNRIDIISIEAIKPAPINEEQVSPIPLYIG